MHIHTHARSRPPTPLTIAAAVLLDPQPRRRAMNASGVAVTVVLRPVAGETERYTHTLTRITHTHHTLTHLVIVVSLSITKKTATNTYSSPSFAIISTGHAAIRATPRHVTSDVTSKRPLHTTSQTTAKYWINLNELNMF